MNYDPDEQYIIEDNVEALKLIVEQGVLDQMKPIGTANSSFYAYSTPTHWCLASKHIGHDEDKDNGYCIILMPKSRVSVDDATSFFADCIRETTSAISMSWLPIAPKGNN